jgi:hypothetical protein
LKNQPFGSNLAKTQEGVEQKIRLQEEVGRTRGTITTLGEGFSLQAAADLLDSPEDLQWQPRS